MKQTKFKKSFIENKNTSIKKEKARKKKAVLMIETVLMTVVFLVFGAATCIATFSLLNKDVREVFLEQMKEEMEELDETPGFDIQADKSNG